MVSGSVRNASIRSGISMVLLSYIGRGRRAYRIRTHRTEYLESFDVGCNQDLLAMAVVRRQCNGEEENGDLILRS
jgi:hypothetical protein